jgi:DNA topoisomerase-1
MTINSGENPLTLLDDLGLCYVCDTEPGLRRVARRDGFSYTDARGREIRDEKILRRIRAIVIPPAWTDVWICADANGHIQATGRDARGRKQYRYHVEWSRHRNETKYDRMTEFGESLMKLRRRYRQDLKDRALTRSKVTALAIAILDETQIRVGNTEYARANRTYGLTTLRDRHVQFSGATVSFVFKAKAGKMHQAQVEDKTLARIVRACRDLPGQQLFQYTCPDGSTSGIGSADINRYLYEATGRRFTAKDFRTWGGSKYAVEHFLAAGNMDTKRGRERLAVNVIKLVAAQLNNTPATCRKYYIHPAVLEAYVNGTFFSTVYGSDNRPGWRGLEEREKFLMKLLVAYANRPKPEEVTEDLLRRSLKSGKRKTNRGGTEAGRTKASG